MKEKYFTGTLHKSSCQKQYLSGSSHPRYTKNKNFLKKRDDMTSHFSGNALWSLVAQSDAITLIVLFILLGLSLVCWTIFFYKIIMLRIKKKQVQQMRHALASIHSFEDLRVIITAHTNTMPGYFLQKNLALVKSLLDAVQGKSFLTPEEYTYFQEMIEQNLEDLLKIEESYMPVLFTSASVSPLLGLFGTVWGLIHAFIRISQQQSADIATVAPGIAEALITTLVGLLVAIPALVMYHAIMTQIRTLEHQLVHIAQKFDWLVQTHFKPVGK